VHYGLAITLAESTVEASAVVLRQVVPDEGLTTELVHSLEDLIWSVTCNCLENQSHTL
jgi:hypothetical protein